MNKDKLILDCINFLKLLDKLLAQNRISIEEYNQMRANKVMFLRDCGVDYK